LGIHLLGTFAMPVRTDRIATSRHYRLVDLARRLRRDERTVRDWLSGRQRVPWWVPEILRLKRIEADLRHRQMGMGALAPMLGIVSAAIITLAQPELKKPQEGLWLADTTAPDALV